MGLQTRSEAFLAALERLQESLALLEHGSHDQSKHGRRGGTGDVRHARVAGAVRQVLKAMKAGGGTFRVLDRGKVVVPSEGIMVGHRFSEGHSAIVELGGRPPPTKSQVVKQIKEWAKAQNSFVSGRPTEHYGVWVNEGKLYLDVSTRVPEKALKKAMSLGGPGGRNQIGVFRLSDGEYIPTGGTGED